MKEGGDWGFLSQLVKFMGEPSNTGGVLLTGLWDENHITLHVSSGFVVLAVGNLPGEVRDEKGRVTNPASGVVENLRGRERLVTTLVSENPETGTEKALDDSVESPEPSANWGGRNVFWSNESVEENEGNCQTGDVPSDIAQPPQARSFEAVFGNCISNIVDRVVRNLKLVSIGINELAKTLLLHIIQRGH